MLISFANVTIDYNEIWYAAVTCWSVQALADFFVA